MGSEETPELARGSFRPGSLSPGSRRFLTPSEIDGRFVSLDILRVKFDRRCSLHTLEAVSAQD